MTFFPEGDPLSGVEPYLQIYVSLEYHGCRVCHYRGVKPFWLALIMPPKGTKMCVIETLKLMKIVTSTVSLGFPDRVLNMSTLRFILVLFLITLSQGSAFSEKRENSPIGYVEEYQYEAVPMGNEGGKEQIGAVLSFGDNRIVLSSKMVSQKGEERILLKMTREGALISGTKNRTDNSGRRTEARLWRDEHRVYIEQTSAERKKTTAIEIPLGSILATEGSLVVLLRSFPFESTAQWHLFMIDFSGRSSAATASQADIERIGVPAGEFTSYRVEILFGVPVLHFKVVCWVAREKPHVLVKSVGKRGLMTPTYVTSLTRQQMPGSSRKKMDRETSH